MNRKSRFLMFIAVLVPSILLVAGEAAAVLQRVGPLNSAPTVGNFPAWYQDNTYLTLEFCDPQNQAEVDGGWCLLLPADVTIPEVFPTNFFDEHFYFAASADANPGTLNRALMTLALESAFATGNAVPGQQIAFARIRFDVRSNTTFPAGTYRFIHPYGEDVIVLAAPDSRIFFTEDIGIACPAGTFDCALESRLGPFLLPSATPGGAEMPPLTEANPTPDTNAAHFPGGTTAYPGTGKSYIADPARIGPVTGSPLPVFEACPDTSSIPCSSGDFRNHNMLRIEGPTGSNLGGAGVDFVETTDFTLMGRVFTGAIPGQITVDRASYTRNSVAQKVDVFATGFATAPGRLPADPIPTPVLPALSFFDAPCAGGVDPVGATETSMSNAGSTFWGEAQPLAIPAEVCVKDSVTISYFPKSVVDEVYISEARYDPVAQSLSVKARSSDTAVPPTLTLGGFGDLTNGEILLTSLSAAPCKIRVLSTAGSVNESQVTTSPASPTSVTLGAAPADNTWAGNSVTYTATVNDGTGPFQYEFWMRETPGGTFALMRSYLQSNSWTWDTNATGSPIGDYEVMVNVRAVGSASAFEATDTIPYGLTEIFPASAVTLTPFPTSYTTVGDNVVFTASATGGIGTYEYQFWLSPDGGATWSIQQAYSTSDTWVWNTSGLAAGKYYAVVWVRNAGSSASLDTSTVLGYTLFSVPLATSVAFTPPPSPADPQAVGVPITWTAAASGGSGTYEYQFWLSSDGGATWSIQQAYSTSDTWIWTTSGLTPGKYYVAVWARSIGSSFALDTQNVLGFTLQ